MRTNSIISDPEPTKPIVPALTGRKAKPTDMEKIANSEDYPQFAEYISGRIKYYERFTPSGEPVENLTEEQRIAGWASAVTIIKEYEGLLKTLHAFKRPTEQSDAET